MSPRNYETLVLESVAKLDTGPPMHFWARISDIELESIREPPQTLRKRSECKETTSFRFLMLGVMIWMLSSSISEILTQKCMGGAPSNFATLSSTRDLK